MAIKDWKKIGEMKWRKNFKQDSRTHSTIYIMIVKEHKSTLSSKMPWIVNIGNVARGQDNYFKTKTQALAYAKAYMRKH